MSDERSGAHMHTYMLICSSFFPLWDVHNARTGHGGRFLTNGVIKISQRLVMLTRLRNHGVMIRP